MCFLDERQSPPEYDTEQNPHHQSVSLPFPSIFLPPALFDSPRARVGKYERARSDDEASSADNKLRVPPAPQQRTPPMASGTATTSLPAEAESATFHRSISGEKFIVCSKFPLVKTARNSLDIQCTARESMPRLRECQPQLADSNDSRTVEPILLLVTVPHACGRSSVARPLSCPTLCFPRFPSRPRPRPPACNREDTRRRERCLAAAAAPPIFHEPKE